MVRVRGIKHLQKILLDGDTHEFFIQLKGNCRSSKQIYRMSDGKYDVLNEIDDTWQELTAEQIMDPQQTNIGTAIKAGAFYWWKPRKGQTK